MHSTSTFKSFRRFGQPALAAALALAALWPDVGFAATDIASTPIARTRTATVKPNITVLMDTSQSMAWTHMPDEMEGTDLVPPNVMPAGIGYRSAQCNALYYNPLTKYELPADKNGVRITTAPLFTAAPYNVYSTDTTTRDLSRQFQAYDRNTRRKATQSGNADPQTVNEISYQAHEDAPQAAYYWVYTGSAALSYNTSPCNVAVIGTATAIDTADGGRWTKVTVSATSGNASVLDTTDERTNFAIWYTYYRTRMALTKSAVGLAFLPVTDTYKVGLISMNPGSPVAASKYEALGEFDPTKRTAWYTKLYAQIAESSSPAREALARVGRNYASKTDGLNTGMTDPNPNNYSCQQNFTIMTTDGYWNTAAETVGPVKLDYLSQTGVNRWVGRQDNTLTSNSGDSPRPIWDGGTGGSRVTTDMSNTYSYADCDPGLFNKTVTRSSRTDTVVKQSTFITNRATSQTTYLRYSTARTQTNVNRTQYQILKTQTQQTEKKVQWQQTATQNRQQDTWRERVYRTVTRNVYQTARTDLVARKQTVQTQRTVTNLTSATWQTKRWTTQVSRTSSQLTKTTTTWPRLNYQTAKSTFATQKATAQTTLTRTRMLANTVQIFEYNGATEQTRAVASCTPGGNISCATERTNDIAIASCPAQTNPVAENNYVATTCRTETVNATAPISSANVSSSCPSGASASTAGTWTGQASSSPYYTTTCVTTTTAATNVDPSTCTASNGTNSPYQTVTCTPSNTGPTFVDVTNASTQCPSGTSRTTVNTWTTAASSGNGWVRTVCQTTQNATTYGDAAGCQSSSLGAGPNYVTTTCTPNVSSTGTDACTESDAASPAWTQVRCTTANPGTQGVLTDVSASNLSSICPSGTNATTAGTWTQSATSGNSYVAITCTTTVSAQTAVNATGGTCPASTAATLSSGATQTWTTAAASNSGTRVDCTTTRLSGPTPIANCTVGTTNSGSPNFVSTVCASNTVFSTAAIDPSTVSSGSICPSNASATANGNWTAQDSSSPYNTTTCATTGVGNWTYYNQTTVPSGCPSSLSMTTTNTKTQAATASAWQTVTCEVTFTGSSTNYVNPSTCPSAVATTTGTVNTYASNTRTSCITTVTTTTNVAASTCPAGVTGTASTPTSPDWQTIVCNQVDSAAVRVDPATCPVGSTTSGNTTTICREVTEAVRYIPGTCTVVTTRNAGNNWTQTACPAPIVNTQFMATCVTTPAAAAGNNYTILTCAKTIDSATIVNSCTPSGPTAANDQTTTTCDTSFYPATNSFNNTPVDPATCTVTDTPASDANGHVRTQCTTSYSVSTNTAIDPVTASSVCPSGFNRNANGTWTSTPTGPNWITNSCRTTIVGPTNVDRDDASQCPAGTSSTSGLVTTKTRAGASGNGYTEIACATTQLDATPVPVLASTCTANVPANNGNGWVRKDCTTNAPAAAAVAQGSCVPNDGSASPFTTVTCTPQNTGPTIVDPATCVANDGTTSPFKKVVCDTVVSAPYAAACQASAATQENGWTAISCNNSSTGPDQVSSCSASSVTDGVFQVVTNCTPVPGSKIQYTARRSILTEVMSGTQVVSASGPVISIAGTGDVTGVCYPQATRPALPSPNPRRPLATEQPQPDVTGCTTAWPCVQVYESTQGGSLNSLADVAQYYYATDLRPDLEDNVATIGNGPEADRKKSQHMTTFVLGLGVSGTLKYSDTYRSDATGDFADLRTGANNKMWPVWPSPDTNLFPQNTTTGIYNDQLQYNDPRSIDDFWHTAVNGRGQYFSAKSPSTVVKGISDALDKIAALNGAGTGAATSTLVPTEGDNFSFIASYLTQDWVGDIKAYEISIVDGSRGDQKWSAQEKLQGQVQPACDSRNIFVMGAGTLRNFAWDTAKCSGETIQGLTATEKQYFDATAIQKISQYSPIPNANSASDDQKAAAPGANLVNFLRGQRQYEGYAVNTTKLYRTREFVLGDIVNSQPIYVPEPRQGYGDEDYAEFKTAQANRIPMLYAGGNDGMLHAFYAPRSTDTDRAALAGKEAWAVVPTDALPNMVYLAETDYKEKHKWFVDGTAVSGDAYDATAQAWKTILVGGMGAGGKSFYALDITNPDPNSGSGPKGLWEFKLSDTCYDSANTATAGADCHLGYSFGRPVITKIQKDGGGTQWVVMVTSGYNNVRSTPGTGDGVGYLYVLDAFTGKIIYKLSTGKGDADNPSGLREINTYVANFAADNTTQRVYGADVLGNVFRFDVNDSLAPSGRESTLIGTAKDANGKAQPITTRPVLAEYTGKTIVVVGTGRLLGVSDLADESVQSVYSFVDSLGTDADAISSFRDVLKPMTLTEETVEGVGLARTISCSATGADAAAVDAACNTPLGWYVDLPEPKERVNIDMQSNSGTLVIVSNVPSATECNPTGHSWLMQLDILNGKSIDAVASKYLSSMIAGISLLGTSSGTKINLTETDGSTRLEDLKKKTPPPAGKRISWREIGR